jgi:hypothetical protein
MYGGSDPALEENWIQNVVDLYAPKNALDFNTESRTHLWCLLQNYCGTVGPALVFDRQVNHSFHSGKRITAEKRTRSPLQQFLDPVDGFLPAHVLLDGQAFERFDRCLWCMLGLQVGL